MKFIYEICKEIYLLGSRGCAFCVLPWQFCLCTLIKIKLWQAPSKRWLLFQMAASRTQRTWGGMFFFLFPFHKRGGAQSQRVSCSKVISAASGREENCICISQVSSLGIPHKSLKLFRALKQLLRSQGHLTRTTCSDFNSWWKKSLLLALQTLGGGVCPL